MTDNMNKSIDNEELDLDQLENVSGGAFHGAASALGAAKALGAVNGTPQSLGVAKPLMCGAIPLSARKMMNEAGIRSSMNSTSQDLNALLLNSDKMLDDKK